MEPIDSDDPIARRILANRPDGKLTPGDLWFLHLNDCRSCHALDPGCDEGRDIFRAMVDQHLEANDPQRYALNDLSRDEITRVEAHTATCAGCADLIRSALRRSHPISRPPAPKYVGGHSYRQQRLRLTGAHLLSFDVEGEQVASVSALGILTIAPGWRVKVNGTEADSDQQIYPSDVVEVIKGSLVIIKALIPSRLAIR